MEVLAPGVTDEEAIEKSRILFSERKSRFEGFEVWERGLSSGTRQSTGSAPRARTRISVSDRSPRRAAHSLDKGFGHEARRQAAQHALDRHSAARSACGIAVRAPAPLREERDKLAALANSSCVIETRAN